MDGRGGASSEKKLKMDLIAGMGGGSDKRERGKLSENASGRKGSGGQNKFRDFAQKRKKGSREEDESALEVNQIIGRARKNVKHFYTCSLSIHLIFVLPAKSSGIALELRERSRLLSIDLVLFVVFLGFDSIGFLWN